MDFSVYDTSEVESSNESEKDADKEKEEVENIPEFQSVISKKHQTKNEKI